MLQRLEVLEERDQAREEWQKKTKEDFARVKTMLGELECKVNERSGRVTKELNKLGEAIKQGERQVRQSKPVGGVVDLLRNIRHQLKK